MSENKPVRVAQRSGRNTYRKVLVHVTNPDHYDCHPPALRPCPDPNCRDYPIAKCPNCGRWTHDHTKPKCYLC